MYRTLQSQGSFLPWCRDLSLGCPEHSSTFCSHKSCQQGIFICYHYLTIPVHPLILVCHNDSSLSLGLWQFVSNFWSPFQVQIGLLLLSFRQSTDNTSCPFGETFNPTTFDPTTVPLKVTMSCKSNSFPLGEFPVRNGRNQTTCLKSSWSMHPWRCALEAGYPSHNSRVETIFSHWVDKKCTSVIPHLFPVASYYAKGISTLHSKRNSSVTLLLFTVHRSIPQ